MYEYYLLNRNGFGIMGGMLDFSVLSMPEFSDEGRKEQIPPFESETLKEENKSPENRKPLPQFGKAQLLLVLSFIAFELTIFSLCAFLPE
jgi:hypothetical protein